MINDSVMMCFKKRNTDFSKICAKVRLFFELNK